jgi:uracil-DNA glycosylase
MNFNNMNKPEELKKIQIDMEEDKNLPLVEKPQDVVPGYGNPDAKIFFIGEAAGYHESVQRKPFVGQAGKLLDKVFLLIKIDRGDVYITNMVKTRPPNNRDPFPHELKAFENYLDRELSIIKPDVVVTLGRFSMAKFLPEAKISSVHGKKFMVECLGTKVLVIPMYHPAAALRNGAIMEQFRNDFLKLPQYLKELENEKIFEQEKPADVEQMELI